MKHIGVADTTFARFDMAAAAIDELKRQATGFRVKRYTVPGVKDLPCAAKDLIDDGCDIVMALAMPGPADIDRQCAHEASQGLIQLQVQTGVHVIEVFVHESEADDDAELRWLAEQRSRDHAVNVVNLLYHPERLERQAGTGQREGFEDAEPL